jgi:hypothetical protein
VQERRLDLRPRGLRVAENQAQGDALEVLRPGAAEPVGYAGLLLFHRADDRTIPGRVRNHAHDVTSGCNASGGDRT